MPISFYKAWAVKVGSDHKAFFIKDKKTNRITLFDNKDDAESFVTELKKNNVQSKVKRAGITVDIK